MCTGAKEVFVPIVSFSDAGEEIPAEKETRQHEALSTILRWGPIRTEEQLLDELRQLRPHGTRVIIDHLCVQLTTFHPLRVALRTKQRQASHCTAAGEGASFAARPAPLVTVGPELWAPSRR